MSAAKLLLVCLIMCLMRVYCQKNGCKLICQNLYLYGCEVCYEQCEQRSWFSSAKSRTFEYKSCKQRYCSLTRRVQSIDLDGQVTSTSQCETYDFKLIEEKNCLQKCCGERSHQKFIKEHIQQCIQFNNDVKTILSKITDQIGPILYSVIGVIGWLVVICAMCCCCQFFCRYSSLF